MAGEAREGSSTSCFIIKLKSKIETAASVQRQAAGSQQHSVPVRQDQSPGQISPQVGECPYFRGAQSLLGSEGQGTWACVYFDGGRRWGEGLA